MTENATEPRKYHFDTLLCYRLGESFDFSPEHVAKVIEGCKRDAREGTVPPDKEAAHPVEEYDG